MSSDFSYSPDKDTIVLPAPLKIGIIGDTHVPDRMQVLSPEIETLLLAEEVSLILHTGDVSHSNVLDQLSAIAPVHAVRGNRDWVWLEDLPFTQHFLIGTVHLVLTHGHGRWWDYFLGHFHLLFFGYQEDRYSRPLRRRFPSADVIVFGHTHVPMNKTIGGQLLFNPGTPHFPDKGVKAPSIGIIEIDVENHIGSKLLFLEN